MVAPAAAAALPSASQSAPMPPLGWDMARSAGRGFRRQTVQQRQHRARRAWTEVGAEHRIEPQRALERRRLEVLLEQVMDVHAADAQQLAHVAPSQAAYLPAHAQQREPIGPSVRSQPRRRSREYRREGGGEAAHAGRICRICLRIRGRQALPCPARAEHQSGAALAPAPCWPCRWPPIRVRALPDRARAAGPPASECSRWAPAETRKPGANSRSAPRRPAAVAASSTSTLRPPRASVAAQTRPLWPPPMTMHRQLLARRRHGDCSDRVAAAADRAGFRARHCGRARP